MKLKKKIVAMVLAICILCVGAFSAASAGSICDFFASAGKTIAHGLKTVGNAVVDTGEYLFTSKDASECYEDTVNSAKKVAENACNIADNAVQIGKDTADLVVGSGKVIYGGVCAAGTALYATEEWIRTGEKDFSTAGSFVDTMKEGYKQADNGIFTDLAIIGGAAMGVPTYAIVAANAAKAGIEYAVDYKTGEETINTLISTGISAATMGAGAAAGAVAGSAAGAVTGALVGTGAKIGMDICNDKDDRSVLDIVLEDVCVTGVNAAVGYGARKLGDAARGNTAANNNPYDDDSSSMDEYDDYQDGYADSQDQIFDSDCEFDIKVNGYENDSFLDPANTDFNAVPGFDPDGSIIDLNTSGTNFVEEMVNPFLVTSLFGN